MRLLYILIIFLCLSFVAAPVHAQGGKGGGAHIPAAQEDTAPEPVPLFGPPLPESLNLDAHAERLAGQYEDAVARAKVQDSWQALIIWSGGVLLLACGFAALLRYTILTIRRAAERSYQRRGMQYRRLRVYSGFFIGAVYIVSFMTASYALAVLWDYASWGALSAHFTVRVVTITSVCVFVLILAIGVWEALNSMIERSLRRATENKSNRARTLLPLVRHVILVFFLMILGLVLMGVFGVNTTPLLAGAGIIGVAIGLGAQSMVKDFLTGLTNILEDVIQVGDVVKLGDLAGVIEKITLRKVQLRDMDGTVYTIPFSEIKIIQNLTKEFSFYVFDVLVSYRENTDHVTEVLKSVGAELKADVAFNEKIMEPIEVLGVDRFTDNGVVIKARIKTMPLMQWSVGREFNRRMKMAFDAQGIEMPYPQRTIYFGQDKAGTPSPAHIKLIQS